MSVYSAIVIGGGAAGFFTAINIVENQPDAKVLIIEKSTKLLSKVKVSGGGRCNVTHFGLDLPELVKRYPRGKNFLKKAFHQFNTLDTEKWFGDHGVKLHAEKDGRMFPSTNDSQTIIDCFLATVNKLQIEIRINVAVESIVKEPQYFSLFTSKGEFRAQNVVLACGGFPKKEQFGWIENMGLKVNSPVPSLFTFNIPNNAISKFMGLSVPNARIKIAGSKLIENGPLLITHWGLSGPVVLRLSAWGARELADKNYTFSIGVNWLGDINENELRESWSDLRNQFAKQNIGKHNPWEIPNRLWLYFLETADISPTCNWSELKSAQQNKLIQILTNQPYEVKGKTTFKEEFVTCGGVDLQEIDANTMQSKKVEGLYFVGEIMDIDGITGGFNFQNAWTTGWIAAKSIAIKF